MAQVLKLNAAYVPIGLCSWQDAMIDWCNGKIEILETYEDKILHAGYDRHLETFKTAMEMPAVVRLTGFIAPKKKHLKFYQPFTRKNIYVRDAGKCQFCGSKLSMKEMTLDHVMPKSRGGHTNWTNIVCACVKCNSKKADRTPTEAGMKLRKKPFAPKVADNYLDGCIKRLKAIPSVVDNKKWREYIYWNVEIQSD